MQRAVWLMAIMAVSVSCALGGENLTAITPSQKKGELSIDHSPAGGPLDLGDVIYQTGIGVKAGTELTYEIGARLGRFEAWVGIDPKASPGRSGRFRVYADDSLVFDSGAIDQAAKRESTQNPARPIRVVVPLAGVKTLRLTFQCEDDKDPSGLCGGWGDAQFVPASAPEYRPGIYPGKTLAPTPPMGWNTWCRYGTEINERLIHRVADAMVDSGMRDAGYVYLGLDDGWQPTGAKFDDKGYPLWDTKKFPGGMKALGDYLHSKGLKYGIYSRAEWVRGHETQFARRFADWGVDLVKYDFSNRQQQKATLDAIRATGRDVVFSVCEWGNERPWLWAPGFNAEMWRTTYDVKDKWTSRYDNNGGIGVLRSAHQNEALGPFVGPGRWNDLDMLQVGVDGFDYGNDRKKAGFDITPDEERLQMTLWAILASPLLAANDVTAMNDQTRSILLNKQVIAVDQDPLGIPGWRVKKMDQIEVWKRSLDKGDIAVALVNLGDKPRSIDVDWPQLNIHGPREAVDLWEHRSLGKLDKSLKVDNVPSHAAIFLRLSAPKGSSSPPRGWNSYTGYSIAVTEAELLKNIDFLSEKLLKYGYDTVTVDNGWFLSGRGEGITMALDAYGRPESHPHFFPHGLKYTIDYAHKKGVKFGIWLLRGINRRAMEQNLPVEGTKYRMRDIVDLKSTCPWAATPWWNYGVDMTKPGAQEYYDGLIKKYADLGVDFIKFDDMVPSPAEVDAVAKAIRKCGRPIVLSLSPGDEIKVEHSSAYKKANMVRITSDIWDNRGSLETTFKRWEAMQAYDGPDVNSWLDMDMICFGRLYVVNKDGGWECKFTKDQKRSFMVQRALAASPLMLGGVLYRMDDFSMSLFTHPDILQCNQNGVIGRLVYRRGKLDVWRTPEKGSQQNGWIGLFNRDGNKAMDVELSVNDLGMDSKEQYVLTNLWNHEVLPSSDKHVFSIPADGVVFLRFDERPLQGKNTQWLQGGQMCVVCRVFRPDHGQVSLCRSRSFESACSAT